MKKLHPLACGGVTLGVLQGLEAVDFNQIWFQLLYTMLNALITLLLGGDISALTDTGSGSLLDSLFL
jgi:hypothetical protein